MGMFGFMGSESRSSSTTITKPADQRIGVEGGMAGQLIGPEATVSQGGGIATRTGDYSPLTQTITGNKYRIGMTGGEVADLLRQQSLGFAAATTSAAETNAKMAALATTALSTQAGLPADWTKYILPVGVLLTIVALARAGRRK